MSPTGRRRARRQPRGALGRESVEEIALDLVSEHPGVPPGLVIAIEMVEGTRRGARRRMAELSAATTVDDGERV